MAIKCKRHYAEGCGDEACAMDMRLAGDINAERSRAHNSDPNLRTTCRECGETYTGTKDELTTWITEHVEDIHGDG